MSPSQPTEQHDVIVVGGRVAGAATALLLATHGLRVLVLERDRAGTDTRSTHALMRGGVLQLQRWGLLDRIVAAGTPAVRQVRFTYPASRVVLPIEPSHGVDALYAPRRTVLDPILLDAAARAGATIRHRSAVLDVLRTGGRVSGVRTGTPDGQVQDLGADLVIGADGADSTVARLVGAPTRRQGRHGSAVAYGYWSGLGSRGYEWVFRPGACSGAIPTNDGLTCVFAAAPPARIGRGGTRTITRLVAEGDPELAARLERATPPTVTRTWPGRPGHLRASHGPGWALVGDAAYYKDPISAHGLTDALRDAELLARAVLQGGGDDAATAAELAGYDQLHDRISRPLFDITDRIATADWTGAEIPELLIRLSGSMTDEMEVLASLPPLLQVGPDGHGPRHPASAAAAERGSERVGPWF